MLRVSYMRIVDDLPVRKPTKAEDRRQSLKLLLNHLQQNDKVKADKFFNDLNKKANGI